MGLVNREERNAYASGKLSEPWVRKPLGSDVHKVVPTCLRTAKDLGTHMRLEGRVVERSTYPHLLERIDLIEHERDERGHHDGKAGE